MQACGLTPNLVSYGICMDACAKAGLWEKVCKDVVSSAAGDVFLRRTAWLHEKTLGSLSTLPRDQNAFSFQFD